MTSNNLYKKQNKQECVQERRIYQTTCILDRASVSEHITGCAVAPAL